MALLQVRNFPDDVYGVIATLARTERRSVAQQTTLLVERGLAQEVSIGERRKAALTRAMARTIPAKAKTADTLAMIREDRNR